ncbi:MAG: universal stress protein [Myxococcales bacterium]|nr:universal stress protein [Myxococcales bacterium]MCB9626542.1 universal stress protein [Sandaracinaceae bacterium]
MSGTTDRLLVAADLTEASDAAVRFSAAVAKALAITLELVHVVDSTGSEPLPEATDPAVQVYLAELQKRLDERRDSEAMGLEAERARVATFGVRSETRMLNGRVWEAVLTRAKEVDARFVVVGPHGKGPGERVLGALGEWLLGSTADRVVRHASCPVWVVPTPSGEPVTPLQRIMVAVDFSAVSARAIGIAADLARGAGGELHLVHILPPGYRGDSNSPCPDDLTTAPSTIIANDAKARVHRVAQGIEGLTVHESVRVAGHSIHDELLLAAKETGATELVLGSHSRSVLDQLVLGNTAERMIKRASIPTLVVRG